MTAASELKSAAVVQKESRKRKTPDQSVVEVAGDTGKEEGKEAVQINAIRKDQPADKTASIRVKVEQVFAASGSTTAGATQAVAAAYETSGSWAATASKAASMQATRLPVSVFSRIHESSQPTSRIEYRYGTGCRSVWRVQAARCRGRMGPLAA